MDGLNLELLKELRKRKGLTQKCVAKALGFKTSVAYHYIEKGRCSLHAQHLSILAQLFDVPMDVLLRTILPLRKWKYVRKED